jgi:hypothetical protein
MGLIRMGPPEDLLLLLRKQFSIDTFIEAGTFHGATAAWAARCFGHVKTIEYHRPVYESTASRYDRLSNVEFIFGDTRSELKKIVPSLESPAIFWLDAHWSGADTYGEQDECPLIEEISTVNGSGIEHFILCRRCPAFLCSPTRATFHRTVAFNICGNRCAEYAKAEVYSDPRGRNHRGSVQCPRPSGALLSRCERTSLEGARATFRA